MFLADIRPILVVIFRSFYPLAPNLGLRGLLASKSLDDSTPFAGFVLTRDVLSSLMFVAEVIVMFISIFCCFTKLAGFKDTFAGIFKGSASSDYPAELFFLRWAINFDPRLAPPLAAVLTTFAVVCVFETIIEVEVVGCLVTTLLVFDLLIVPRVLLI